MSFKVTWCVPSIGKEKTQEQMHNTTNTCNILTTKSILYHVYWRSIQWSLIFHRIKIILFLIPNIMCMKCRLYTSASFWATICDCPSPLSDCFILKYKIYTIWTKIKFKLYDKQIEISYSVFPFGLSDYQPGSYKKEGAHGSWKLWIPPSSLLTNFLASLLAFYKGKMILI